MAWVCQLCQGEEDFCYFWFLSLDNYCNWAILNLFHYFLLSFINSINFHSLIFITSINFCPLISLIFILSIIFHFYQPQSGMVMQKCRSKKRIKKGPMFFLVCMVIEFLCFNYFNFLHNFLIISFNFPLFHLFNYFAKHEYF